MKFIECRSFIRLMLQICFVWQKMPTLVRQFNIKLPDECDHIYIYMYIYIYIISSSFPSFCLSTSQRNNFLGFHLSYLSGVILQKRDIYRTSVDRIRLSRLG